MSAKDELRFQYAVKEVEQAADELIDEAAKMLDGDRFELLKALIGGAHDTPQLHLLLMYAVLIEREARRRSALVKGEPT